MKGHLIFAVGSDLLQAFEQADIEKFLGEGLIEDEGRGFRVERCAVMKLDPLVETGT